MDKKIAISMIVLLYKGKKYLNRILKIFEENYANFLVKYPNDISELILVNDYPEESLFIPTDYKFKENVNIISNKENVGIHKSKIIGLEHAKGEYVFFLDQDDLITGHYFIEQYKQIEDADAIICNVDNGWGPKYSKDGLEALDLSYYLSGYNAIVSLGQVLFKKSAIPREWIDNPLEINGSDDYYLMLMMLLKRRKMIETRTVLYYHVYTGINLSLNSIKMFQSGLEVYKHLNDLGMLTYEKAKKAIENINKEKDLSEKRLAEESIKYNELKQINLYNRWLKNLESGYSVDSYIKSFGVSNVAIYGAGVMGKHLLNWLTNTSTHVEFLIDQNQKGEFKGIPIVNIEEAKIYDKEFELIIVTPINGTNEIVEELEEIFNCNIISLESVIYNMPCQSLIKTKYTENIKYVINANMRR